MVKADQTVSPPPIRCRQIADADLPGVAALLRRGFGTRRTLGFWRRALARLEARATPVDMPRYGYLLESDGRPVGAIVLLFAATPGDGAIRANVSSWYCEPAFRSYAPLLVSQALKRKSVTYMNISAVRHTWPILDAQGYHHYSNGIFVALTALQGVGPERAPRLSPPRPPEGAVGAVRAGSAARARRLWVRQLLVRNARAGISFRVPAAPGQSRDPPPPVDLLRR